MSISGQTALDGHGLPGIFLAAAWRRRFRTGGTREMLVAWRSSWAVASPNAGGSVRLVRALGRPSSVFNAVAYGGRG